VASSVQIKIHQDRTSTPGGYKITTTVLGGTSQTVNIPIELFVYRYVDGVADTYQHICNVADIENLPAKNATGWNRYGALYRVDVAALAYSTLSAAEEQALVIAERLQELATAYAATLTPFEATNSYTYKSDDESISITLRQVGDQTGTAAYEVASDFYLAVPPPCVGITDYLFVLEYVDGTNDVFKRVATINDIETLPEQGGTGWDTEGALYRAQSVTYVATTVDAAEAHAEAVQLALSTLPQTYFDYQENFEGSEDVYYYS